MKKRIDQIKVPYKVMKVARERVAVFIRQRRIGFMINFKEFEKFALECYFQGLHDAFEIADIPIKGGK